MIDTGWTSAFKHTAKRLFGRRQGRALLLPVGHGGLVTPVRQLAHGVTMRASRTVGPHGGFTGPGRDSPEGVSGIDYQLAIKKAFRALRLP